MTASSRRALARQRHPEERTRTGADAALLALLTDADRAGALARSWRSPLGSQAGRLFTASRSSRPCAPACATRSVAPRDRGGPPVEPPGMPSGRAEAWRVTACGPPATLHARSAEAAGHDLDVVSPCSSARRGLGRAPPRPGRGGFLARARPHRVSPPTQWPLGQAPRASPNHDGALAVPGQNEIRRGHRPGTRPLARPASARLMTRTGLLVDAVTDRLPGQGADVARTADDTGTTSHRGRPGAQVRADRRHAHHGSPRLRRLLLTTTADAEHAPRPSDDQNRSGHWNQLADDDGTYRRSRHQGPHPARPGGGTLSDPRNLWF